MEQVFQATFTRNNQFYGTSHHLSWTNTGFWKSEASLPSDLHPHPHSKRKPNGETDREVPHVKLKLKITINVALILLFH